jgi:hypothetical protein
MSLPPIDQLLHQIEAEAKRLGLTEELNESAQDGEDVIILALTYYVDHLQEAWRETDMNKLSNMFWVVTSPTHNSTLIDICFSTNIVGLALQVKGGLSPRDIVGRFDGEDEAMEFAKNLLKIEK